MASALLNRLAKLESRLTPAESDFPTLHVSFVGPGEMGLERAMLSATCNGRTFVRTTGESEAEFADRVDAETRTPSKARVIFLETEALPAFQQRH